MTTIQPVCGWCINSLEAFMTRSWQHARRMSVDDTALLPTSIALYRRSSILPPSATLSSSSSPATVYISSSTTSNSLQSSSLVVMALHHQVTLCRVWLALRWVTIHPGQLSLLSSAEREMSIGQSVVMLCSWGIKTGMVHSTCG